MDLDVLEKIPTLIPNLLQYIMPGYIFILFFDFILLRPKRDKEDILIKSVAISLVLVSILRAFLLPVNDLQNNGVVSIAIALAMILSIITAKVFTSDFVDKWLKKLGVNRTVHSNIWHQMIDEKNGVYAAVYLKEEKWIVRGYIRKYEISDNNDVYIVLDEYYYTDYKNIKIQEEANNQWRCIIKLSNIDIIELYYDNNSTILQNNHIAS